jgi:predicted O-methyltransferase YrrM
MRQPGFPRYAAAADYPPPVWAAVEASRETGCERACTPEFGRLLRVLAAGHLRIGETGTACGVGAGWIVSGLRPGASLVTVELEPRFAGAAARVLGTSARVLRGDWTQIREFAPFDLLFCDHGADKGNPTPMLELLAPDGLLVLDDLTPEAAWTDELCAAYPAGDPLRQAWAARGDVAVAEVLLTPTESALLVQRIG